MTYRDSFVNISPCRGKNEHLPSSFSYKRVGDREGGEDLLVHHSFAHSLILSFLLAYAVHGQHPLTEISILSSVALRVAKG